MRLFNPDNALFRRVGMVADVFGLSILWLFTSAPLFTMALTSAALYDAVYHSLRLKEGHAYARFWQSCRQNWRILLPAGLIWGVAAYWLYYAVSLAGALAHGGDKTAIIIYTAAKILLVIPFGWCVWSVVILARFRRTLKEAHVLGFKLALASLPSTIVMVLLVVEIFKLGAKYYFTTLVSPVLTAWLLSLFAERIFAKYTKDDSEH